jgi:CheY-like chemotaxis protein
MQHTPSLRVLIVDDDHDGADALGMTLEYLGCEVRLTQSGEEAINVAPTFAPQLVVLDLNMPPGMDGYQTAAELRNQAWSSRATFVAHTGCTDSSVAEDVRKAGFGYLIPKPASATTFEALVGTLLAK